MTTELTFQVSPLAAAAAAAVGTRERNLRTPRNLHKPPLGVGGAHNPRLGVPGACIAAAVYAADKIRACVEQSVLQCVLQCVAVCCSVLHCVAVCCSVVHVLWLLYMLLIRLMHV